jgi:DNA-binding response OmpR family regulator
LKNILILEDTLIIQKYYTELFKSSEELVGYNLLAARNVADAESLMLRNDVDLFVVDWLLGKSTESEIVLTGIDFVKKARNHYKYEVTPIIMVTSVSEKEQIREALNYKIDGYMLKPIVKETFIAKIKKHIPL